MCVVASYFRTSTIMFCLFPPPALTVGALVLAFDGPPFEVTEDSSSDIGIIVTAPTGGIAEALTFTVASSLISAGKFVLIIVGQILVLDACTHIAHVHLIPELQGTM